MERKNHLFRAILLALALMLGVSSSVALPVQAKPAAPTFNVDATSDSIFAAACTTPVAGKCSLREAIIEANAFAAGGVTINIPEGTYTLSIMPSGGNDATTGDLNITKSMAINGADAPNTFINANHIDRAFKVESGTVSISNVTITNGGGNGICGGGVENLATLTLNSVYITGNQTTNCSGGGIANVSGTLTMIGSTVSNNLAPGPALGLGGGGIYNAGAMTIVNSTISNNSALKGGGGIQTDTGVANIYFSTIAGNLADPNATGAGTGGGIRVSSGTVNMKGTILGQNFAGTSASDCAGAISSLDFNLIQTTNGCGISGNNITNQDPQLDSLFFNGAATPTRALYFYSPAKDAVPTAQCTDPHNAPLTVDQRGQPRPSGSACDIGAYEGSLANRFFGINLIRNSDAEGSAFSYVGERVGASDWLGGGVGVVAYGTAGFPTNSSPGPNGRGMSFFAGGNAAFSIVSQIRNAQDYSASIDTGKLKFDISGYFGGFDVQDDYAELDVDFRDGSGTSLSPPIYLGKVKAADRSNITGLLFQSGSGLVPAGTRSIILTLGMTRASGTYNDGYADNLSFVIEPPPPVYLPLIVR